MTLNCTLLHASQHCMFGCVCQANLHPYISSCAGKFGLDEFIAMSVFLTSAGNVFRAFDAAKAGRVTLDFNQFLYAAANCR